MKHPRKYLLTFCLTILALVGHAQSSEATIDSTQYATIYVCRPFNVFAALMGFGIRNEGVKLFRLRNNSVRKLKIYKSGPVLLSAKCVDRVSKITIAAELGKSYYIRCTPRISYLFANPKLQLVDDAKGKQEYGAIVDEN